MMRLPLLRPSLCLRPRRNDGSVWSAPWRARASAITSRRSLSSSVGAPASSLASLSACCSPHASSPSHSFRCGWPRHCPLRGPCGLTAGHYTPSRPSRRLSSSQPEGESGGSGGSPDETPFANLDHRRSDRAGFPEAVFGGKTPSQLRSILQSMTDNVNTRIESAREGGKTTVSEISTAIIATRVDKEAYEAVVSEGPLEGGTVEYHETARIISVKADAVDGNRDVIESSSGRPSVVVACAGTTDLPVAEEAALTLSLCGIRVERVYDCGVAGLHRIIGALPRLRDPDVGCVIVCAGMDGALPSVVGGLVDVPTVACPTSVGYGASFNGVAGLLTMLNSCSPGVSVVNIDNGFGAAVFALKVVNNACKR